jgi:hypothetical protein
MAAKFVSPNFEQPGHQGSHSLDMASRMVYRVVSVLSITSLLYYRYRAAQPVAARLEPSLVVAHGHQHGQVTG